MERERNQACAAGADRYDLATRVSRSYKIGNLHVCLLRMCQDSRLKTLKRSLQGQPCPASGEDTTTPTRAWIAY